MCTKACPLAIMRKPLNRLPGEGTKDRAKLEAMRRVGPPRGATQRLHSRPSGRVWMISGIPPAGFKRGGSNAQRTQQNNTQSGGQNCNRNRIIIEPVCP
jgi:hypothetical protein